MTTRNAIRQQNAERRLSHARWEHEPTIGEARYLLYGLAIALFAVIFFAVRY